MRGGGGVRGRIAGLLGGALLSLPGYAHAQLDPLEVLYVADFVDPTGIGNPLHTPHGLIAAIAPKPPYEVLQVSAIQNLNGALSLDPLQNLLYGGRCCLSTDTIYALDATTLEPAPERSLSVPNSGSVSTTIDALRRVLYVLDTVTARLSAVDLASGRYGRILDTLDLPQLPKEPLASSGGNMLVYDGARRRLFLTSGVGGAILAVDVSSFEGGGGRFGAPADTGQRCRTSPQSSGALALDEVRGRVATIAVTGRVRFFAADAPYTTLGELLVPDMGASDCGLFYDGRTDTLYVGREFGGNLPREPVAIDLSAGFPGVSFGLQGTTTAEGGVLILHAMAFSGPTGPFAHRPADSPDDQRGPLDLQVRRVGCSDLDSPAPRRSPGATAGGLVALAGLGALLVRARWSVPGTPGTEP